MSEEMYRLLHKLLLQRVDENDCKDHSAWSAYENALTMLEYAHDNNYDCLIQFAHDFK